MTEGYFPGSSQPLRPATGLPDPLDGRKGKTFTINGGEVELFTISDVAELLNRRPVTIRKWEEKKIIPTATYSKPGANKDPRGRRRLYSRDQVVALVQIAEAEGILHNPHAQISKTHFKEQVLAEFKRLAQR